MTGDKRQSFMRDLFGYPPPKAERVSNDHVYVPRTDVRGEPMTREKMRACADAVRKWYLRYTSEASLRATARMLARRELAVALGWRPSNDVFMGGDYIHTDEHRS